MKKKLVTAVTAASMLATIFGSSVFAAGRPGPVGPDTTSPKAKYTVTPTEGSQLIQVGTSNSFGFYSDDADKGIADNDVSLTFTFFRTGANNLGVDVLETADLKAVSSNSNILVAWAYTDAGAASTCEALDDTNTTSAYVATDIVTDVDSGDDGAAPPVSNGQYVLCIAAKTATTAATGTITVYASKADASAASSWVTMKTVTVTAVGPLASLTLSLTSGYKYIAGDGAAITGGLTLIGKDANGTVLNGATGAGRTAGVSLPTVAEYGENPTNVNDGEILFFDFATEAAVADATPDVPNEGSKRLFDIEAGICDMGNGDDVLSDAGKSYTLKVAAGDVVSNGILITCTGDGSEAVLQSLAPEVTSFKGKTYESATGGTTFKIIGTIVDENGLPMGDGANAMDFGTETFTGLAGLTYANLDANLNGLGEQKVVGGKAQIATLAPTNMTYKTHKYSIKVTDSNLGSTEDVAKTYSMSYAVSNPTTITVKMNAAKTVATVTVNFGEDAADESAYLEVETATGSVKTYRKIANASGVATWTIALRRQQVFMTASSDASDVEDSNLAVVTFR